ncbi:MAG: TonB-dependent receptor [Thermodesulfobacteriota bacterium]|nr:TonB-dependent receptor [Thermodesulfobacteriota bacterium]
MKLLSLMLPDSGSFCRTSVLLVLLMAFLVPASFPLDPSFALAGEPDMGSQGAEPEAYPRFELEEVVVTSTPAEEPIRSIPRNVTVITSEDIAQAPSNNVADLLAREADVDLRSFYGNDKQAGVDIRGMGETSVSNVIVMVDGFRLNSPDILGPDLTSVPLDQIERIEIVRGAASVVYGDGAVGGVINIITQKGGKEPEARLHSSYGSYDTFDERASYQGRAEDWDFNIHGTYFDSDGYRDNGFLEKRDVAGRFGYDLNHDIRLSLAASYHDDEYGLPAGVAIEDIASRRLRDNTGTPDDFGETTDRLVTGGVEADMGRWGVVSVKGGWRLRDNDFILGFNAALSKEEQMNEVDEDTGSFDLKYSKEYKTAGLTHQFQAGLDYYRTDYISERPQEKIRKNTDVNSLGLFFSNQLSLLQNLTFHLGYRYNAHDGTYRTDAFKEFGSLQAWVNGDKTEETWHNDAYDIGLLWSLSENISLYASYATSFRIPNVDELARPPADACLGPQEGKHVEIGTRYRVKGLAEASLTLFHIRIEDEIFFDESSQSNKNADEKTRRQGVEVDLKTYPTETLYLWGNYTYMTARFEATDVFIPLVPRYKASAGIEWRITDPLLLAVTETWVGARHDGNDKGHGASGDLKKLDAYQVFDVKLTYAYKGLKLFVGVNNLFDELYSTLAFGGSHYTMPTRNYYGGLEWIF